MKKLFVLALAVVFVMSFAGIAFAATTGNNTEADWNPAGPTYRAPGAVGSDQRGAADGLWTDAEGSPHDGYDTDTNKCEVCHSPHQAGNGTTSYKLLYGTTSATTDQAACEYCHVQGVLTIAQVYRNAAPLGGHDLASEDVPDSIAFGATTAALKCSDCHSVHGANTLAGAYILKANPSWNGVASGGVGAATQTEFCAKCHDMNHDTVVNDDSHFMGSRTAAGSTRGNTAVASVDSTDCDSCHAADKSDATTGTNAKWPHQSLSIVGLGPDNLGADITTQTAMDGHCIRCHNMIGVSY